LFSFVQLFSVPADLMLRRGLCLTDLLPKCLDLKLLIVFYLTNLIVFLEFELDHCVSGSL